ncbi:hypothetical protein MMMDOFMJ_1894 [Methylobacterium gnaphalii]|nr:hypothetical protein MMMDOFMJ_1894 [Methylobacterium gnaphalii]
MARPVGGTEEADARRRYEGATPGRHGLGIGPRGHLGLLNRKFDGELLRAARLGFSCLARRFGGSKGSSLRFGQGLSLTLSLALGLDRALAPLLQYWIGRAGKAHARIPCRNRHRVGNDGVGTARGTHQDACVRCALVDAALVGGIEAGILVGRMLGPCRRDL